MKKQAQSAVNDALASPELKKRLSFVALGLLIFSAGGHVPLPGINNDALQNLFNSGGVLGLLDLFTGGSLKRFSIFALGIMPYINASIMMQVMTFCIPSLEEIQKERGTEGRILIGKWTKYLTIFIAFIQSYSFLALFKTQKILVREDFLHLFVIMITLVAGTAFLMWLGDEMTERGIGNGVSLLIFAGIVMSLPTAVAQQVKIAQQNVAQVGPFLLFGIFVLIMIGVIVYMQLAERRIPIRYSTRTVGQRVIGGQISYLPVRVDIAGVIPIIFAISALLIPQTIANFLPQDHPFAISIGQFLSNWGYYVTLGVLTFLFTFLYSSITFKPEEIAKNLKKAGGFIPGIRPGKQTEEYIQQIQEKITFLGALWLALIAVIPILIANAAGVSSFAIGGTGLLIVVGVSLDTMRQLEAHVVSRQYKGFMKNV